MGVFLKQDKDIAYIEFDLPDSKVNLLTGEVLKKLDGILGIINSDQKIKAVVISSKKQNVFIAGADIKEIEQITDPSEGAEKARLGQDIFNKLEDLSAPTIAVIDGVVLGGGCELILACTYRIATFNEKVRIGLPEVNLGILPGFGGTYRMPRTVGLSDGLTLILTGKPIDSRKAFKMGLVDRLVPQAGLKESAEGFVQEILQYQSHRKYRPKKKKGILGFMEGNPLGHKIIFHQSRQNVLKASKGFYPAPLRAIDTVKKSFTMSREAGLKLERNAFAELVGTNVCKNLIKVFYLSEKYKKLSLEGAENIKPQPVHKCGILGAGVMGGGIAQLLSSRDISARLKDINFEALASGLKAAKKIYDQAVKKRVFTQAQAQRKMAQITTTLDYTGFQNVDCVIEAVVENLEVKKKVFQEVSEAVSPRTILATNTSALSVTKMAAQAKDPSKTIGFHFFNPVHRMPLIEIIVAPQTSSDTVVSALELAKRLGKIPILVKDSCGFLVNRILLHYINEAGYLLEETGNVEAIDEAITKFGMPMGPFLLSDEVGLDVGIKVLHILEQNFGERFKVAAIFEKITQAGMLGKKGGKGYYLHESEKRHVNPEISKMLPNVHFKAFDLAQCQQRLVFAMVNEAARCLEDGIIKEADTVDAGMIFGTGFPPFHGGLLRYADQAGIGSIVERLDEFCNKFQTNRLRPCEYLRDMAKKGKRFYSR
ncbi:MAG TPA: 3-hydroxyacyl-CoA dehydrogenase NAD-binding domain-containing protein [Candidatus Omnitrophota bacterium]|nr:3-hydroxyacyl-CoA dehydrogenase NAD-binding domain-containing protein [Candidatus Omnitrophota bacterium]